MKKNLLKYLFLGSALFLVGKNTVLAQGYKCGTEEMNQKLFAAHPELAKSNADFNALIAQQLLNNKNSKAVEQVFVIPVVFHIIHINGTENISDAQVIDQVSILNRDFRKLNADTATIAAPFKPHAADTKIEFRLAQLDPDGNCTNGIDRIYSHRTDQANDNSKLNPWPREKYLNVWVIKTMESVGTAGYAYYPAATDTYMFPFDGIIIIHQYIGSIGTANVTNSRALTHEVGHWLNLPHTWGSTNDPTVGCGDDGPLDTPVTKGHDNCSNRFDFFCDSKALTETYDFGSVTTASGATDPSIAPTVIDSGLTFSSFSATGLSANSATASSFDFSNWDTGALNGATSYASLTGAINTGKYYEFTVTPELAQALSLTGLTFKVKRDTNGIRTFAVRSNADSYAANLAASITPANANLSVQTGNVFFINSDTTISLTGSKITLSGALFTSINNTSRTFRIYGWNAEDINGTFSIDDVTLAGTHGIVENVENYMEYSYCSKMYTYDQKDRMRIALVTALSQRNNLSLAANLAATGTDGSGVVCTPEPDFYANKYSVCPGGSVTFTKSLQNITSGSFAGTSVTWSFPGGSPSTATSVGTAGATVNVTYNTPGAYPVTLTATNSGGTGTVTKTNYIMVSQSYAQVTGLYQESFENTADYYDKWYSRDLDENSRTWWLNNDAAYTGSQSVVMNSYYNYALDVDQLFSPSYDLTYVLSPALTFRCAAATTATVSADMDDNLKVYYSTTCGGTWMPMATLSGVSFINNSYHPEEFIPNSPSQWALKTLTLPSAAKTANTRFKFEYTSGNGGNSIFIDDINMTGVLGVSDEIIDAASVSLFPNPSNESTTLSYHLNKKGDTKIEVIDVLGKKIMEVNNNGQTEGDYSVQISKQQLNLLNGIYLIRLSIDNQTITKKLIITK
ncbi:MAG TPA: M43 family zinc metalloprotease [Bacteroidia bacterium]|jgi:PKD repeat protein